MTTASHTIRLHRVLRAPADLLWFGGIGTYIRASSETDAQAGDRTNDAIRIAASQLRCKVIGEGANADIDNDSTLEWLAAAALTHARHRPPETTAATKS